MSCGPASRSTGGHSRRCHARLSTRDPAGRQTVLPGAREQRERVVRPELTRERGGDFMNILANPGALAKRRPIVEQDAQVWAMVAQPVVATTPYTSIN